MKKRVFLLAALSLGLFLSCSEATDLEDNLQGGNEPGQPFIPGNYLGYGYDVINSSYINRSDVKISHPILDQKKMSKDAVIITETIAGEQDFQMFAGSDLTQFYKDKNSSINLSYSGILFSGKFSSEFSVAMNESRVDSNSYIRGRSYRYTQDDYIKGVTLQKLADYLTEDFISVLQTKTATQILDQYGTHVLVRYYKGGSMEFNYTYTGKSLNSNTQLKAALQASYAGIKGEISGNATTNGRELEENSLFHYYTYGGKPIDAFSLQELKNSYGGWLNSIADNADICGIGDFSQSLIPLWELAAADGYSSIARELESEFNARAVRQGKALLVKKIKTEIKEFRTNGTYSFDKATKDLPANIEIYALGAGGGGQGGNYSGMFDTEKGTGGAGGGGAAAYLKLVTEESITLNITIGAGGRGGNAYTSTATQSGDKGADGGATKVGWSSKGITLTANGGIGGGGSGKSVGGGQGGMGSLNPTQHSLYKSNASDKGKTGSDGCFDPSGEGGCKSTGGTSGKLDKNVSGYDGSESAFGGKLGAVRNAGGTPQNAETNGGGGGSGGYYVAKSATDGRNGADGLVLIKVMYYLEE
jgi:hypothetical protein